MTVRLDKIERVALDALTPHPRNPRRGDVAAVAASLEAHGQYRPLVVQRSTGHVLAGNHTLAAATQLGWTEMDVTYLDVDDDQAERILLVDNRTSDLGAYDDQALASMLSALAAETEGLVGTGWDDAALAALLGRQQPREQLPPGPKLADRFLVPPFSVLDARQGYWQDRKREWLALGIQSELGRGVNLLQMSEQVLTSYYTAEEYGGANGTSVFDPVLCELAYRWFSPDAARVLDPFAGGSVRGIVAARLGRSYTGIDLSAEQVAENDAQAARILRADDPSPRWLVGDARDTPTLVGDERFDFVFSCPPYFDLEKYSDDPADLSNAGDWSTFCAAYSEIIGRACAQLQPGRFACFVVGNLREDSREGVIRDLGAATIAAFADAGLVLYNDAILVTAVGSLALRAARIFRSRKLGRSHQQVLVFLKPPLDEALAACGDIDAVDITEQFGSVIA